MKSRDSPTLPIYSLGVYVLGITWRHYLKSDIWSNYSRKENARNILLSLVLKFQNGSLIFDGHFIGKIISFTLFRDTVNSPSFFGK